MLILTDLVRSQTGVWERGKIEKPEFGNEKGKIKKPGRYYLPGLKLLNLTPNP